MSKYIGYKWNRQLLDLMPMAVVSVLAAGISYFVTYLCHFGLYLDGVLKAVICLSVYMGWSLAFQPESYKYTLSIIPSRFKFWERKK